MKIRSIKTGGNRPPKGATPDDASREQGARAAGVPLGKISPRRLSDDERLVLANDPHSVMAERYRVLVSKVEAWAPAAESRIILITSAAPAEGKTTTAMNLALGLAENQDRRILLADVDLRKPDIGRWIVPEPRFGVREILEEGFPIDHAIVEIEEPAFSILPAGEPTPAPLKLLRSARFGQLLGRLRERYDCIVLDSPPIAPVADTSVVHEHVDGVVLVLRAAQTTKPLARKCIETLSAEKKLLGAVLNDVRSTPIDRYYYRYGDYGVYYEDGK